MKIKSSIRDLIQKMQKKGNDGNGEKEERSGYFRKPRVMILLAILLIVSATALIWWKKSSENEEVDPFKDCSMLEENCMDTSCTFYSSCGKNGWQSCKVYDCGNDYGIYSVGENGDVEIKKEAKLDNKAIEAEKEACKGTMEILEQNCVDNKYQAKVKLTTKNGCEIGSFFIFDENDQPQPNSFISADDNTYIITADSCLKITDIIPASVNGIALEF